MSPYLRLLRPQQWIKNVFVFAGLIFSRQFHDPANIARSAIAFAVFALISSFSYVVNDVIDSAEDRLSPVKSKRPVASGAVKRGRALALGTVLGLAGLAAAAAVDREFFLVCVIYMALMTLYSVAVRRIVILDVLFVAGAYVIRAVAGAVIIHVEISSWLIVCTFLLALFIVLVKRKGEMLALGDAAADQRRALGHYSLPLLTQMITVAVAACIVSYCIYTLSPETVVKFHSKNLVYTVPIVIYGMLRFLYLAERKSGGDTPDRLLFTDKWLLISIALWAAVCLIILL